MEGAPPPAVPQVSNAPAGVALELAVDRVGGVTADEVRPVGEGDEVVGRANAEIGGARVGGDGDRP